MADEAMTAREQLYESILAAPGPVRARALEMVRLARAHQAPDTVRRCADDPERYARVVLGDEILTRAQRKAMAAAYDAATGTAARQILLLGGHGTSKTHSLSRIILWLYHARGAELVDGEEGGCGVIITAPTSGSIEGTLYAALLGAAARAEHRGYRVPGYGPRAEDRYRGASKASVSWWEGDSYWMEGLTARRDARGDLAHSAGGRHHSHLQIVAIEEALGVDDGMIAAAAGLSVARNVVTVASTNPTSRTGALYATVRERPAEWRKVAFSQLEHPNVLERRAVISGCVDHRRLEAALRSSAFEQRPAGADPDPARLDFLYALPAPGTAEKPGPRPDGIPGHPDAEVRVFRPLSARAAGQHLGDWLAADEAALLFRVGAIEAAMMRAAHRPVDEAGLPLPPDQVGLDCHPTRPPVECPRWGPSARAALEAIEGQGERYRGAPPPITLGRAREARWTGDDHQARIRTAVDDLLGRHGTRPLYVLDQAWGGDIGQDLVARGARVHYVLFNAPAVSEPLTLYGPPGNRRAEMAMETAAALHANLVALPYSGELLRQMEAVGSLIERGRHVIVRPKADIEKEIGKSTDELDALWLALASEGGGPATATGHRPFEAWE